MHIDPVLIKNIRNKYNLSLAQFGAMVGAPAASVKRWEEGLKPHQSYVFQITLIAGLIQRPDPTFYDLQRQGLNFNKKHWDCFSTLIKSAQESLEIAQELRIKDFEINCAIVSGVKGLLGLISNALFQPNPLSKNKASILVKNIANILTDND